MCTSTVTTFDKIYFSTVRNYLTFWQRAAVVVVISAIAQALLSIAHASVGSDYRAIMIWLAGLVGIFAIILYVFWLSAFVSYGFTGMMLRPDGDGKWSVHMGAIISIIPPLSAILPASFMRTGTRKIIAAATNYDLRGQITLASFLLNDDVRRTELINTILSDFPEWKIEKVDSIGRLGCFSAFMINTAIWTRNIFGNKRRDYAKEGPYNGIIISR